MVVDFDGVIIDGMAEYWWSSRKACIDLIQKHSAAEALPKVMPEYFRFLRPWVNQGWEMVLLAAESVRHDCPLGLEEAKAFATNYSLNCNEALKFWGWSQVELQTAIENVRHQAIATNQDSWLGMHSPFPEVISRLKRLDTEGINFMVLTTKGEIFTAALLKFLDLRPNILNGHEAGSKIEILMSLTTEHTILGFVEDRLATLQNVLARTELAAIPCYLASWGYLKPEDKSSLPKKIHLLETKNLDLPLASWS